MCISNGQGLWFQGQGEDTRELTTSRQQMTMLFQASDAQAAIRRKCVDQCLCFCRLCAHSVSFGGFVLEKRFVFRLFPDLFFRFSSGFRPISFFFLFVNNATFATFLTIDFSKLFQISTFSKRRRKNWCEPSPKSHTCFGGTGEICESFCDFCHQCKFAIRTHEV